MTAPPVDLIGLRGALSLYTHPSLGTVTLPLRSDSSLRVLRLRHIRHTRSIRHTRPISLSYDLIVRDHLHFYREHRHHLCKVMNALLPRAHQRSYKERHHHLT